MRPIAGPAASPWWMPDVHADRRPRLVARMRILAALRALFQAQDFVEVETSILQVSPGNEAHISGFATDLIAPDGRTSTLYLHASPEFACKKLLAAGEDKLFTLARVFRNRDRSALHHPEFTMLEWYRAKVPYLDLIADCEAVIAAAARAAGADELVWRDRRADPFAEPERLSVADAFTRHAGIDLLATLTADGTPDRDALARAAAPLGLRIVDDDSWSDLFSKILSDRIEPHLGLGRPTVLMDYPACEAALARRCAGDPRLAERFELYACGIELANAFGELTDAEEQRRRFELEMDERERLYGERYPLDEDFLACLPHMPEASGIALGLDRLVMLVTGADRIEDVLWTPAARTET